MFPTLKSTSLTSTLRTQYSLSNSKKGKKLDKFKAISCHVLRDTSTNETTIQKYLENVEQSDSEEVSSSDSDVLIDLHLDQEESSREEESSHQEESSHEEEAENEIEELVPTRSGRAAGTWRNFKTYS